MDGSPREELIKAFEAQRLARNSVVFDVVVNANFYDKWSMEQGVKVIIEGDGADLDELASSVMAGAETAVAKIFSELVNLIDEAGEQGEEGREDEDDEED